jgi:Na+/H+-dicarboxylate symporter
MSIDFLNFQKENKCKMHKLNAFNFLSLSLSSQIVLSIFIGVMLGVLLRYKPDLLSFVNLSASSFQHLGNLFIKMVKMIAMPLIFACIMQSVISLCRKASTGRITILTIFVFVMMTLICISCGVLFAYFFQPGTNATFDKTSVLAQYSEQSNILFNETKTNQISVVEFLFNIVPSNIFVSFCQSNFLQIIFFAILFSIGISKVDKSGDIYRGIKTLAKICTEVVQIVMKFAPFGTFGITVWLVATQNVVLLKSLGKLICVDWLCALFIIYIVYSLITIVVLRLNPIHLWRKLFSTQLMAFLTASSASVLPLGMSVAHEKLGVSEEKINFVAPFSAAINSSGGGMYFAMMTIFMVQLLDIELSAQQYTTLFIMCTLCDLGVAPVPSGSLIMLGNVFIAVGIPLEALGIAFAIDRILDMARTLLNFTGDIYSAIVVDKLSNTMNVDMYKRYRKRFSFFGFL